MPDIDWYDKEEVMRACAIGEMARILITAMGWEAEHEEYKKKMREMILEKFPTTKEDEL